MPKNVPVFNILAEQLSENEIEKTYSIIGNKFNSLVNENDEGDIIDILKEYKQYKEYKEI